MNLFPNPLDFFSNEYAFENYWGYGFEFGLLYLVVGLIVTLVLTNRTGNIATGAWSICCTFLATCLGVLIGPLNFPIVMVVGILGAIFSVIAFFDHRRKVSAFAAKIIGKPLQFVANLGDRKPSSASCSEGVPKQLESNSKQLEETYAAARVERAKAIAHPLLQQLKDKLTLLDGGASSKQIRDDVANLLDECSAASKKLQWPPLQQSAVELVSEGVSFLWSLYESENSEVYMPDTTPAMSSVIEKLQSILDQAIEDATGMSTVSDMDSILTS